MTTYRTFLPNYYGSLVRGQRNDATANTKLKCIADEQKVISEIICGGKLTPYLDRGKL